jgi:hypothetical protein
VYQVTEKPKGMRGRTYWRLMAAALEAEQQHRRQRRRSWKSGMKDGTGQGPTAADHASGGVLG